MQQFELEAWLGDDHGLDEGQIQELLQHAEEVEAQYPDADDREEAAAALTVAYRLIRGDEGVVEELAADLAAARAAEVRAMAALRQTAIMTIPTAGHGAETGFARTAGVDRMTVRKWLGK
ncbi:hypothetical protein [Streptomyces sp. NPDC052302]|uniref:hypothetical protein n=1 Tax=Streptomyces sp. NPDC052302 TaxID=3365688 RepID=UPI0037D31872